MRLGCAERGHRLLGLGVLGAALGRGSPPELEGHWEGTGREVQAGPCTLLMLVGRDAKGESSGWPSLD